MSKRRKSDTGVERRSVVTYRGHNVKLVSESLSEAEFRHIVDTARRREAIRMGIRSAFDVTGHVATGYCQRYTVIEPELAKSFQRVGRTIGQVAAQFRIRKQG